MFLQSFAFAFSYCCDFVQAPDPSLCAQVSVTSSHSCCSTEGFLLICFVTAKQFDFLFLASICEGGSPSKSIVSERTGGQCVSKPQFLSCESSHCSSGSFSSTRGHSRMLENARARSEPSARAALAMLSPLSCASSERAKALPEPPVL